MEYAIGIILGVVISLWTTALGFSRDRSFYPTVLMVVASYYMLFAVISGSMRTLVFEAVPMVVFIGLAVAGYKRSAWLVAAGLIGHAVFDSFHHHIVDNTGMPVWWPGFCLSIDYTLGAFLAFSLYRARRPATAP